MKFKTIVSVIINNVYSVYYNVRYFEKKRNNNLWQTYIIYYNICFEIAYIYIYICTLLEQPVYMINIWYLYLYILYGDEQPADHIFLYRYSVRTYNVKYNNSYGS